MSDQPTASSSSSAGRPSLDGPSSTTASSSQPTPNGKSHDATSPSDEEEGSWRPITDMSPAEISTELTRVREERDTYESQYRSLLSKLTTMRATLGDRLRQDAEELDRRETQIEILSSKVDELTTLTTTLQSELVTAHEESGRLDQEVTKLRAEVGEGKGRGEEGRERELSELLERVKLDAHGWQSACLEERAKREDAEARLSGAQQGEELARQGEQHWKVLAERESASAAELSAVLEEFQSSQESELQRALGDYRSQLDSLSSSLAQYKGRAEAAESKLKETEDLASQSEKIAGQVKEKNLLIGKLRHEAVILNEHLTEALRRLRNDQSDSNVDKRLVTNLLIQFITTPRADGKRYEMLNLIAGVLGWKEEERELAGLQRSSGGQRSARPSISARSVSGIGGAREMREREGSVGCDESFSNLFVEFLLSEAERGKEGKGGDGGEGGGATAPSTPSKLLSPTKSHFGGASGPNSPSKSEAGANGDADGANKSGGGGLGSYFGLSRGKK
ncbi:related to RUD3 - suppressor of uso1-1 transport defect [Ustilago sp. UG-2017b]|nr:related to RUD3 - suppressor of uso1-1 transport defect [Ustilago sp. UG-2017b]